MKTLITAVILIATSMPVSAQTYLTPNYSGTSYPDPFSRSTVIDGDEIYTTRPGTQSRDYLAPAYRVDDGTVYRTWGQSGYRDRSAPSFSIESE